MIWEELVRLKIFVDKNWHNQLHHIHPGRPYHRL